jgi:hypothetical protein
MPSLLGVPIAVKTKRRPGTPAVVFSGTGWVWGTPGGPTPSPIPGRAQAYMHCAALCGALRQSPNRPTIARRPRRRRRPELRRVSFSALASAGAAAQPVRRAGPRRCTMQCAMAKPTTSRSCCCAAPTGPSRTTLGNAALRRTAEPKPHSSARAGRRQSDWRNGLGGSRSMRWRRGRCTNQPARRLNPPPAASCAPSPPACRDGCASGARRRTPSAHAARGGRQHSHRNGRPLPRASSCTVAPAGRSVEQIARKRGLHDFHDE